MKIIICGGRNYNDKGHVFSTLDTLHEKSPITLVIDGQARGADTLGYLWAIAHHIPTKRFPANWDQYGRSAGPIRNIEMAQHGADLCVAFPGGSGTQHMIKTAKAHNIPVIQP